MLGGAETGVEVVALFVEQGQVEPARAVDQQVETGAQVARDQIHDAGMATVAVEDQQLAHAGARDRFADVGPEPQHGLGPQRERAGKALVLGAQPDRLGRQDVGRTGCRQMRPGCRQDPLDQIGIDRQRQMRAVLFDRGNRQHGNGALGIEA